MEEKEYYNKNRISHSFLKWFKESPLFARKMQDKEIEQEEKRWQDLGKQIHMFLLEPQEFEKNFVYLEFETPKGAQQRQFCEDYVQTGNEVLAYKHSYVTEKKSDAKIEKEAADLKEKLSDYINYLEKTKSYKAILNKSTWDYLHELRNVIGNHKAASKLLFDYPDDLLNTNKFSSNEFAIYWHAKTYNIDCKSLLDRLVIDHEAKTIHLIDLKSTQSLKDFSTKIRDFGYHSQLAFYWLAVYWYFKETFKDKNIEEYTLNSYIIAVTKEPLIECRVFQLTDKIMSDGMNEVLNLLEKVQYHIHNDVWEYPEAYYEGNGVEIIRE